MIVREIDVLVSPSYIYYAPHDHMACIRSRFGSSLAQVEERSRLGAAQSPQSLTR